MKRCDFGRYTNIVIISKSFDFKASPTFRLSGHAGDANTKRQPRSCDNSTDPLLEDGATSTTLSCRPFANPSALRRPAAPLLCCYIACPNTISDNAPFGPVRVPAVHHAHGTAVRPTA